MLKRMWLLALTSRGTLANMQARCLRVQHGTRLSVGGVVHAIASGRTGVLRPN